MFNIALPIISNVIIAMLLVAGCLVGKRNGWKIELGKFIALCVCGVATYFLTPLLANILLADSAVLSFVEGLGLTSAVVSSTCFTTIFVLFYLLVTIIALAIRLGVERVKEQGTLNSANRLKVKTGDRKTDRLARIERRRLARVRHKQKKLSRVSRVFGAILGVLVAFICVIVIALPVKDVLTDIASTSEKLANVTCAYEYTVVGQFDNLTHISDLLIK